MDVFPKFKCEIVDVLPRGATMLSSIHLLVVMLPVVAMAKPAIVILHNACFAPMHYQLLSHYINSHNYTVCVPELPSTHAPNPTKIVTWDADIAVIQDTIRHLLEDGDVLIVAHGSSTIPASSALLPLTPAARRTAGYSSAVTDVLAIGSPVLQPNQSLLDSTGGKPALVHQLLDDGRLVVPSSPPGAGYWMFNDVLPPNRTIQAINALVPSSWLVNASPVGVDVVWEDPSNGMKFGYLVCQRDNGMPASAQMGFARKVKQQRAKSVDVQDWVDDGFRAWSIESGRSPFLSVPEVVGDWIRREAGKEDVAVPAIIDLHV